MVQQPTYVPPAPTTIQPETAKEKKKRTRNPDNWKKEKRKRAILSGQAYVNTKGELVGPRAIGPDCSCKNKCFHAVSDDNRSAIFNGFYSLKSYDEQNAYLYGLIRRHDIQRKRKPVSERRTCSYKYYVRIKGKEIQVCKKAFANIHGISDKKIRTLCIKHEQNILFPRDNRGRHRNRPKKVTPELVTLIKHHILKMLSGPNGSDFIKTDKNQGPDVNISKLHKSFLQQYEPEAVDTENDKVIKDYDAKVKSWLYFKVFHEEFKSMDFNTVKRKLSDLRRSLEASGAIQVSAKKKTVRACRPRPKPSEDGIIGNGNGGGTEGVLPPGMMGVPTSVTTQSHHMGGYMGTPQQPHHLPQNLQLSVLGLQPLSNTGGTNPHGGFVGASFQQQQQQPLNLQTAAGSAANTATVQAASAPQQPLRLNIFPMDATASTHVPSHYLYLGSMSNLMGLPVSSGGSNQNSGSGICGGSSFPVGQQNMGGVGQQFQPGTILPATTGQTPVTAAHITSSSHTHLLQGPLPVTYSGPQHNHNMY